MDILHVLRALRDNGFAKQVVRKLDQKAEAAIPTGSSDNLEIYFEGEQPPRSVMDRFGTCGQCGTVLWESLKSHTPYICSYCADSEEEDEDYDDTAPSCASCGNRVDYSGLRVDGADYCNRRCVTDDMRRSDPYCEMIEQVRHLLPTPTTADRVWLKLTDSDVDLSHIGNVDSLGDALQELYPEIDIPLVQEEDDLFA